MAALRRLCRFPDRPSLVLVLKRTFSSLPSSGSHSTAAALPTGGSAGAGSGKGADEPCNYCYTLGKHGILRFRRSGFVLLKDHMLANPVFEHFPTDRLIDPVVSARRYYTSEGSKGWLRSSFIVPLFAKELGLTIEHAFVEGNVGVITELNIMAFLELKVGNSSGSAEKYPMTMAGVSNFLRDKFEEVYGRAVTSRMPYGLNAVLKYAAQSGIKEELVIYHPEFLPLDVLADFYTESFRILRKEMVALSDASTAFLVIQEIDGALPNLVHQAKIVKDKMLCTWLGSNTPKAKGLPGILGIPPSQVGTLDLANLTQAERQHLTRLTRKLYGPGYGGVKALTAPAANQSNPIKANPGIAVVVDVHRHCVTHSVEPKTVTATTKLPQKNQASLKKDPFKWQDAVLLLLHKFPEYPHVTSFAFAKHKIWAKLCLTTRMPIPSVFLTPASM